MRELLFALAGSMIAAALLACGPRSAPPPDAASAFAESEPRDAGLTEAPGSAPRPDPPAAADSALRAAYLSIPPGPAARPPGAVSPREEVRAEGAFAVATTFLGGRILYPVPCPIELGSEGRVGDVRVGDRFAELLSEGRIAACDPPGERLRCVVRGGDVLYEVAFAEAEAAVAVVDVQLELEELPPSCVRLDGALVEGADPLAAIEEALGGCARGDGSSERICAGGRIRIREALPPGSQELGKRLRVGLAATDPSSSPRPAAPGEAPAPDRP